MNTYNLLTKLTNYCKLKGSHINPDRWRLTKNCLISRGIDPEEFKNAPKKLRIDECNIQVLP